MREDIKLLLLVFGLRVSSLICQVILERRVGAGAVAILGTITYHATAVTSILAAGLQPIIVKRLARRPRSGLPPGMPVAVYFLAVVFGLAGLLVEYALGESLALGLTVGTFAAGVVVQNAFAGIAPTISRHSSSWKVAVLVLVVVAAPVMVASRCGSYHVALALALAGIGPFFWEAGAFAFRGSIGWVKALVVRGCPIASTTVAGVTLAAIGLSQSIVYGDPEWVGVQLLWWSFQMGANSIVLSLSGRRYDEAASLGKVTLGWLKLVALIYSAIVVVYIIFVDRALGTRLLNALGVGRIVQMIVGGLLISYGDHFTYLWDRGRGLRRSHLPAAVGAVLCGILFYKFPEASSHLLGPVGAVCLIAAVRLLSGLVGTVALRAWVAIPIGLTLLWVLSFLMLPGAAR